MSTETSRISQADAVNYVEGNRRTGGKSEAIRPVTVSETNSCCTTLSGATGESLRCPQKRVVCGMPNNERRVANAS